MDKMTWAEARQYLCEFNKRHNITSKGSNKPTCTMVAVISADSFEQEYSLEARSYEFTNDNKAFMPTMLSRSIYADSLDGSDRGVRLDRYLEAEGNSNGWKVDYCYIMSEDK